MFRECCSHCVTFAAVRLESDVVYLLERGYSRSVLGRKVFLCMCRRVCVGRGGSVRKQ